MTKISVVIPSYNEEKNLRRGVLEEVEKYLEDKELDYDVIIVDDGSSDSSLELVKNKIKKNENFKLIQNSHGGKAIAVITGMEASDGDIVLFTDMDQATPITQLSKFLPKFAAWAFSLLRGIILGLPFSDTQCGFKAFNKAAIKKIIPKIKDEWGVVHTGGGAVNAGFDVELLYLAKKYGFKIAEVPVDWNYVDTERVQVVKDAAAAIYDMFRIRWNDLSGKY